MEVQISLGNLGVVYTTYCKPKKLDGVKKEGEEKRRKSQTISGLLMSVLVNFKGARCKTFS